MNFEQKAISLCQELHKEKQGRTFEFTMGGDRFYMRLEKNKHRIAGIIEKTWI